MTSATARRRLALVAKDDMGRRVGVVPSQTLVLPPGQCLTDIWGHLTPRKRAAWLALVGDEMARVSEATTRDRAAHALPPLDVPAVQAALRALRDDTDEKGPPMAAITRDHRLALLDRLDAVGATWNDARGWALNTGRWLEREVAEVSDDVVDAYLTARPAGPASDTEPDGSRFDALFADPAFWAELVAQCEEYGPTAPGPWQTALAALGDAARRLLALVDPVETVAT